MEEERGDVESQISAIDEANGRYLSVIFSMVEDGFSFRNLCVNVENFEDTIEIEKCTTSNFLERCDKKYKLILENIPNHRVRFRNSYSDKYNEEHYRKIMEIIFQPQEMVVVTEDSNILNGKFCIAVSLLKEIDKDGELSHDNIFVVWLISEKIYQKNYASDDFSVPDDVGILPDEFLFKKSGAMTKSAR